MFDLGDPGPPADLPIGGVPSYVPLQPGADPRLAHLPVDVTLWRFGRLYCAKRHDGRVLCTWHLCGWLDAKRLLALLRRARLIVIPQWDHVFGQVAVFLVVH